MACPSIRAAWNRERDDERADESVDHRGADPQQSASLRTEPGIQTGQPVPANSHTSRPRMLVWATRSDQPIQDRWRRAASFATQPTATNQRAATTTNVIGAPVVPERPRVIKRSSAARVPEGIVYRVVDARLSDPFASLPDAARLHARLVLKCHSRTRKDLLLHQTTVL